MKIVVISPLQVFPYRNQSGSERCVFWESEWLDKTGQDYTLILSSEATKKCPFNHVLLSEKNFFPIAIDAAKRMNADLILTRGNCETFDYFSDCKIPTIVAIDGGFSKEKQFQYFKYSPYLKWRFLSKDHFNLLAITEEEKKGSFWCHHGLPENCFINSQQNKIEKNLVWWASLVWGWYIKGLDNYLRLANSMEKSNWNFYCYGSGNFMIESELNELSKTVCNFKFKGSLLDKDKNEVLSNSLGFCQFNCAREPFGLTTIESMARGCPIITIKGSEKYNGTTSEIINKDVSIQIERYEDIENIFSIDRNKVYNYCRENFHIDLMMKKLLSAFDG